MLPKIEDNWSFCIFTDRDNNGGWPGGKSYIYYTSLLNWARIANFTVSKWPGKQYFNSANRTGIYNGHLAHGRWQSTVHLKSCTTYIPHLHSISPDDIDVTESIRIFLCIVLTKNYCLGSKIIPFRCWSLCSSWKFDFVMMVFTT